MSQHPKHQLHKTAVLLLTNGVVFVAFLTLIMTQMRSITAQSPATACSPSYAVGASATSGSITTALTGTVMATLTTSIVPPTPIQSVLFTIDGTTNILGRAAQSSTYYWNMPWATAATPNGPHQLVATLKDANGYLCTVASTATTYQVNNLATTNAQLVVQPIMPINATVPTNNNVDFTIPLPVMVAGIDVSQYAVFEWQTTIGSVIPGSLLNVGRFASGPTAGSGNITTLIKYGGQVISRAAPVQVIAPASPATSVGGTAPNTAPNNNTNSPNTVPANGASPTYNPNGSTQPPVALPTLTTQLLNADSTTKQCLLASIGEARLKALETENVRPTPQEFEKYRNCFAKTSFVVPSSLAPVAPAEAKKLKESGDVTIAKAENSTTKQVGTETKELIFRGKAKPSTPVLLYVFSEPMVLSTTADSDGNWSYSLENPLEPGNHEAYAMVDKGNGDYQRSSVFGFIIGKASASATNPNGYSLSLAIAPTSKQNNRSTNLFVMGIALTILLPLIGALAYKVRQSKKHAKFMDTPKAITPLDPPFGG